MLTEGHQKFKISTDCPLGKPDKNAKRIAERTFSQPNRPGESQHNAFNGDGSEERKWEPNF